MDKNKKLIIIGVVIVILVSVVTIGLTYAYFTSSVIGNDNATDTVIETADLRLVFTDTEVIDFEGSFPGSSVSKTFTIENKGNVTIEYDINLVDVINEFVNNDLVYSITSDNGGSIIGDTPVPIVASSTLLSGSIEANTIQTYTIYFKFLETGLNQNSNMGAVFSGKLQINTSGIYNNVMNIALSETTGENLVGYTSSVEITGSNYGTLKCESEDETVATCNVEENILEVVGEGVGSTTIELTESRENTTLTYSISIQEATVKSAMLLHNEESSDENIDFAYNSAGCGAWDVTNKVCTSYDETQVTNGLYYTADVTYGEDGEKIYYYRGDIDNNWVDFAGYKWRIVRTTSEGGVRLIYSGDGLTETSAFITKTNFNRNVNGKYYIGYTYNTDLNGYEGEQTDSNIKKAIDAWYTGETTTEIACNGSTCDFTGLSTKVIEYSSYISNTAVYCSDRSMENSVSNGFMYPTYDRLNSNKRPTFACPNINASRYTVDEITGNGYLINPISLLSADEIYYAGLSMNRFELSHAFYIIDNTIEYWWVLSPISFEDGLAGTYEISSVANYITSRRVWGSGYVRPSVSLKSCVTVIEGDGSKEKPYILSNNKC